MNKKSSKDLRRILVSFFIKLVVVYALFLALWVGVSDWYPEKFQTIGSVVIRKAIQATGSRWVVLLNPMEDRVGRFDTSLAVLNKETRGLGQQAMSSLSIAYLPMAMTLSLILATPVPWKRRIIATILGSFLVSAWISLALFFMVLNAYCGPPPLGMYAAGAWLTKPISFVTWVVSVSTVPQFVVPVFIWLLVTVRGDDVQRLAGKADK